MATSDLVRSILVSAGVTAAGLAGYHALLRCPETTKPTAAPDATATELAAQRRELAAIKEDLAARAPAGAGLLRRVLNLEARLAAGAAPSATGQVPEDKVAELRALLAEVRKREQEEQEEAEASALLARIAPEVPADSRAAVAHRLAVLLREKRQVLATPMPGLPEEAEKARAAALAELKERLQEDLRALLPDEVADFLVGRVMATEGTRPTPGGR
jgi:hypothetical protein